MKKTKKKIIITKSSTKNKMKTENIKLKILTKNYKSI